MMLQGSHAQAGTHSLQDIFGNVSMSPYRSQVNGQSVNLPYSMEDGKLSMYRCGYFGIVKTSFGMTLKFNWNSHVSLTLPSSYSSYTGGKLCLPYWGLFSLLSIQQYCGYIANKHARQWHSYFNRVIQLQLKAVYVRSLNSVACIRK